MEKTVKSDLDEKTVNAHEKACAQGLDWYLDPHSGLLVFTRLKLLKNGACCGSGCRHCPYELTEEIQTKA
jgi:hypothetical protein